MSKFKLAVSFISGAAIGIFISYERAKNKYEKLYQEELESVKETYAKSKEFTKAADSVTLEDDSAFNDISDTAKEVSENLEKFHKTLDDLGYSKDEVDDKDKEKPYIIPPEEFGEFEDYDCICLTYYSDGVLAEAIDGVVEDVDEVVGEDFSEHFGEYEDDSVFIRNDRLKADYEILRDYRRYSDVLKGKLPVREEQ